MKENLYAASLIIISLGGLYVFINILLQRRAEKRLETLIHRHRGDLIFKIFDAPETKRMHTKVHLGNQDFEKHILLILMREQIELLKKEDKFIMKKTLNRKDQDNQLRYAMRIFSKGGLKELFVEKKIDINLMFA